MKGYPKHLNTKADYEYVRQNFPRFAWKKDFEDLLTSSKDWVNMGEITGDCVTDDTHKVVTDAEMDSGEKKSYQFELKENPTAKIFRIGYTVDEVEKILQETE